MDVNAEVFTFPFDKTFTLLFFLQKCLPRPKAYCPLFVGFLLPYVLKFSNIIFFQNLALPRDGWFPRKNIIAGHLYEENRLWFIFLTRVVMSFLIVLANAQVEML